MGHFKNNVKGQTLHPKYSPPDVPRCNCEGDSVLPRFSEHAAIPDWPGEASGNNAVPPSFSDRSFWAETDAGRGAFLWLHRRPRESRTALWIFWHMCYSCLPTRFGPPCSILLQSLLSLRSCLTRFRSTRLSSTSMLVSPALGKTWCMVHEIDLIVTYSRLCLIPGNSENV